MKYQQAGRINVLTALEWEKYEYATFRSHTIKMG